jgi:hypothetical protein
MGGTNSETINGLRFHINNDEVHIHDDAKSLKFIAKKSVFSSDIDDAINQLDNLKCGVAKIDGTSKEKLCLVKDEKNFFMFIMDNSNSKSKLESFLKGC